MSETQPAADDAKPAGQAGSGTSALKRLGKYEVKKLLGKGGMGAVYLAVDTQLKRTVALKVLPKDKAKNPILVKRFHAEAQTAAALRHDNIIMVFEADHADGYDYIAMEYVEGTDAARLLETRGLLPVRRATEIVRQVALALEHASQQGVVHRDIKPANLMIRRDGVVKLADMGLARIIDDTMDTSITRVGTTVGTVDYMSPEQARDSKAADVRSDIYSLGCTWYFLLTGEPPFPAGSLTNKLRAHAEKAPPDPRQINDKIPESVVAILNRMLAKQPKARYQTAAELVADLDRGDSVQRQVTRVLMDDDSADLAPPAAAIGRRIVPDESSSDVSQTPDSKPTNGGRKPGPAVEWLEDETDTAPEPRKSKKSAKAGVPEELVDDVSPARPRRKSLAPSEDPELDEPAERRKSRSRPDDPVEETDDAASSSRRNRVRTAGATEEETEVPEKSSSRSRKARSKGEEADQGELVSKSGKSRSTKETPTESEAEKSAERRSAILFYVTSALVVSGILSAGVFIVLRISKALETPPVIAPVNPFAQGGPLDPAAPNAAATAEGDPASGKPSEVTVVDDEATTPTVAQAVPAEAPAKTEWELDGLPEWPGDAATFPLAATVRRREILVETVVDGELPYTMINPLIGESDEQMALSIRLRGPGPFALRPIDLSRYAGVSLAPASGTASASSPPAPPVVYVLPSTVTSNGSQPPASTILAARSSLDVRDIEFVVDASRFAADDALTILQAEAGQVRLQGVRVTVLNQPVGGPTAQVLSLPERTAAVKPETVARVLVQRCAFRGERIAGIAATLEGLDLIVRDSFIWSRDGQALGLGGTATDSNVERQVRIRRSTLVTGREAVQLADSPARPIKTQLDLRRTLVAAVPGSGGLTPAIVRLSGWNTAQTRGAVGRVYGWRSEDCHYSGFTQWLSMHAAPAEPVTVAGDVAAWNERWQSSDSGAIGEFHAGPWLTTPPVRVVQVEPSQMPVPIDLPEDRRAGATFADRVFQTAESLDRLAREASRPQIPEFFATPMAAPKSITVDLGKDDLAKVLMEPGLGPWVDVEVLGGGVRPLGTIILRDRYVRLRCTAPDGRLTSFLPRQADEAWITVINGGLDVSGAAFGVAAMDRTGREKLPQPKWYFRLEGADLVLRNCRAQSPLQAGLRTEGLIQVVAGSGVPARPVPLSGQSYVVVRDSFLASAGPILRGDWAGRSLFVRNSALVSRGELLSLAYTAAANGPEALVDMRATTLVGSSAVVRVDSGSVPEGPIRPLALSYRACLFARPLVKLSAARPAPALLLAFPPALSGKQLAWTEESCGYAAEWTKTMLREGDSKDALDFAGWGKRWGSAAIQHPLADPSGVLLPDWPADLLRLDLPGLEPLAACQAAKWLQGKPIGANIPSLTGRLMRSTVTTPTAPGQPGTGKSGKPPVGL
jgi:eukaryotic-like serine/threonine-protein kinase